MVRGQAHLSSLGAFGPILGVGDRPQNHLSDPPSIIPHVTNLP